MSIRTIAVSVLCLAVLSLGLAHAQTRPGQRPGSTPDVQQIQPQMPSTESGAAARHEVAPEKAAPPSQTSHLMRLDGRDIKYTATAGTLPIRLDDGKVAARMFFVAYTKDGEDSEDAPGRRSSTTAAPDRPPSGCTWGRSPRATCRWPRTGSSRRRPISWWTTRTRCSMSPTWSSWTRSTPATAARLPGVDNAQFHDQEGDLRAFGEFIANT